MSSAHLARAGRVLITGASAGIGAQFAHSFAGRGHDLILVARRADKLEQLAAELRQRHRVSVEVIAQDLGLPAAAEQLRGEVWRRDLQVDILVNNAGLLQRGELDRTSLEDQRALLQLNVTALTEITQVFLPAMLQRGHGRILNVASSAAFLPLPYVATYAASKTYVLALSEALSSELRPRGVTVTALCPGFTETDMIRQEGAKTFQLPGTRNMSAAEVAEQGYAACMAGRPVYINGWLTRLMILFGQHLPRWLQRRVAAFFSNIAMR